MNMNKSGKVFWGILAIGLTVWIFQNRDHIKVPLSQPLNHAQRKLREQVKIIEPYAMILSKELAWDRDLARAFMFVLNKGNHYYHFELTRGEFGGDDRYYVGIGQLTTYDVEDGMGDDLAAMNALNNLWEFEEDILMIEQLYAKHCLSKETYNQCLAQWVKLDPRFDEKASMAILVGLLRKSEMNPAFTAYSYLEKKGLTKDYSFDGVRTRIEDLSIGSSYHRTICTSKQAKHALERKLAKVKELLEEPVWFERDLEWQRQAVIEEQQLYANARRYMTVDEIQDDYTSSYRLIKIDSQPEIGLYLGPIIDQIDPVNTKWYKTLDSDFREALCGLAKDCHDQFKTNLVIMSGNRPVSYQNKIGNASVSHPTGKAVDIQIDPRPCWRWVKGREVIEYLRKNCQNYGVDFYTERSRNHLHIFLTEE